jgi:glycosyltransferase involved in cell wall biosynthesis
MVEQTTVGAVLIAAHDEEAVLQSTLHPLEPLIGEGVDVVVAANGCSDRTAEVARAIPGVRVLELKEASKTAALNAADEVTDAWPRLYLDADIVITPAAVRATLSALREPDVLAARPPYRYQTQDCAATVRSYYRARSRIPAMSDHLWGAGVYGLSAVGHARFDRFPDLVADDLYIDSLFDRSDIRIVSADPVSVECPRTTRVLLRVLRRVYSGRTEVMARRRGPRVGGLRAVVATAVGPSAAVDAVVYVVLAATAKLLARRPSRTWQRDDTSRRPAAERLTSVGA